MSTKCINDLACPKTNLITHGHVYSSLPIVGMSMYKRINILIHIYSWEQFYKSLQDHVGQDKYDHDHATPEFGHHSSHHQAHSSW